MQSSSPGAPGSPIPLPDQVLSILEVARDLHCSKAHVYNAIAGQVLGVTPLPAIRMGRRVLVRRRSLEAWKDANESAPAVENATA